MMAAFISFQYFIRCAYFHANDKNVGGKGFMGKSAGLSLFFLRQNTQVYVKAIFSLIQNP